MNGGNCWGNLWQRWRRWLRWHEWHICGAHYHVVGGLEDVREGIGIVWEVVNELLLEVLLDTCFQGWQQSSEEIPQLLDCRDTVPGGEVLGDE